ncbi:MAG: hypothetical protein PHC61_06355, partial [Chitinivibrionales bacterium]|nr:hypothetical protein [Chitinivibrionales bacterium]
AMFRLRDEIVSDKPTGGLPMRDSAAYTNQIAYHIGAKVKANDQVSLAFDIGNDWYATDEFKGITGNYYTKRDPASPWFDLAYVQWDPGYMHIVAGIIPVKGSALMDLLGVSLFTNKNYAKAAHLPWGVITNFSQTGLRIGAPICKDQFKLGIELMTAMIEQRPALLGLDSMLINHPAVELYLELPMSFAQVAGLNVTPQIFIIPNRTYNKLTDKNDMELGLGLDAGYKLSDMITLRSGIGYAQNSNDNSYRVTDTAIVDPLNTKPFKRSGINFNIGATVKVGPGKIDGDFNLSTCKDDKNTNINDLYPFVDLKYGWAVNKNFILMPRCRFFIQLPKTAYDYKLTTRPELIFTGTF